MRLSSYSLAIFALVLARANAERFLPFPLRHLQRNADDIRQTRELQLLLSDAIYDAVSSSPHSLSSQQSFISVFPNVKQPCLLALISLMDPKMKMKLAQMIDATGKPASGLFQGATTWMGNFDQCVGLGMNHCLMPFNTSFALGTPLAPLCAVGPMGGPSWGICLPKQCDSDDALELVNFGLKQYLPAIVNKSSQLNFIGNLSMLPGRCQSADEPAPKLSAGLILFLVVIAYIGIMTVLGTACDYFFLVLGCGKKGEEKGDFDYNPMRNDGVVEPMEKDVEGNRGAVNGGAFNGGASNGGASNGGAANAGAANTRTDKIQEYSLIIRFLLCFSMITNGRKILSLAPATDNIGCINGIRFLSLTWVILGHCYAFFIYTTSNPVYVFTSVISRVTIQPIINGTFSVDSFFVLSGLLTAYLFFKRNGSKKESFAKKIKTVFLMYLHRYLRLTPALGILMGFSMLLPLYMTSGPKAATAETMKGTCDTYWWYNILYINNFYPETMECVGHVWYLANDMQFFLLSPIILYAFKCQEIAGYIVASIFWLASMGANIGITTSGNYGIMALQMDDGFADIYIKPWTRIGPYIIGMVAGYLLYKYRKEDRRPSWVTAIIWWMVSTVCALSVIYGLSDYYKNGTTPSKAADVLYLTFSRSAWGIAIAWLVIACSTERAGPINTLLSWTPFGPVSRINYSAYLYHILVMSIIMANMRNFIDYNDYLMATLYCGVLVLSYGVAFLTAMWFESPFIGLEKLIF